MDGRRHGWFAIALVAVGCAGEPTTRGDAGVDAGPQSRTPLEVEVWAGETLIELMMREPERPCDCTFGQLPAIGECESSSDGLYCDCFPDPAACVTAVRVWEAGAVVAEHTDFDLFSLDYLFVLPAQAGPRELEIVGSDGCAGSMRAPLPDPRSTAPEITSVTSDDDAVYVAWEDPGAPASVVGAVWGYGLWQHRCHGAADAEVAIRGGPRIGTELVDLAAIGAGPVLETRTELGTVRARALEQGSSVALWRTTAEAGGGWLVGADYLGTATLTLNGNDRSGELVARGTLSGTAADPRYSVSGTLLDGVGATWSIEVVAGATTDRIEVAWADVQYAGETPHVVPAQVPTLGVPGRQRYQLATPSVVLAGVGTTPGTITVALALEWEIDGLISRPLDLP